MTTSTKRRFRKISPKQAKALQAVARPVSLSLPDLKGVANVCKVINQQLSLPNFYNTLPDIKSFLDNTSSKVTLEDCHSEEVLFHRPVETYYQKPMHPTDQVFFARILKGRKEIKEENENYFNWKTMSLVFPEGEIQLSPMEKTICAYLFQDPTVKVFSRETVEIAIYGQFLSDSERLKQVIKRINWKAKPLLRRPVFKWAEERIEVLI